MHPQGTVEVTLEKAASAYVTGHRPNFQNQNLNGWFEAQTDFANEK